MTSFINRISNANSASCFIPSNSNIVEIYEYLEVLDTNVMLCEAEFIQLFQSDEIKIIQSVTLFNRICAIIQFNQLDFKLKKFPIREKILPSSKILFYGLTSGTSGTSKSVGVTCKCFMPNVLKLG